MGVAPATRAQTGQLLIGERLPLQELGIEAQREQAASNSLPPLHSCLLSYSQPRTTRMPLGLG
jgi:hypothetical protein